MPPNSDMQPAVAPGRSPRALPRPARFISAGLLLAALLLAASAPLSATQGIPPLSSQRAVLPASAIPEVVLPPTDVKAELAIDAAAAVRVPLRYAVARPVQITPASHGSWEQLPDGRLWRLRLRSEGATDLNLAFTKFWLPDGVTLHLMSESESYYQGPYTAADNNPAAQLWTPVVPGAEASIELFVPAGAEQEPLLELTQVGAGYRDLFHRQKDLGGSKIGDCEIDVVCPVAAPWTNEIRSVGRISIGGTGLCTGTLIMDAPADYRAFFLTANHCGISEVNASSVVVYWNYQSPTCGQLGGGSLAQNQSGAVFRAAKADVDVCLIELYQLPDSSFNVYYAGWDRSDTPPAGAVGIHHPNGDVKAISFSTTPLITIDSCIGTGGSSTHWQVLWSLGVTEPGSSGSGIWDSTSHLLVGILSGGASACGGADLTDCYGKFSVSWASGSSPADRLQDWLDPQNTGVSSVSGSDPFAVIIPAPALIVMTNVVSGGNGNGIIDFNECNSLSLVLTNVGSTNATGIQATLSSSTPGVVVAQPVSTYPDIPVGGTNVNDVPFQVSTTPGFVCGTTIEFTLVVKCDQLTMTTQFSLPTGIPLFPFRYDSFEISPLPDPGQSNSVIVVSNMPSAIVKATVALHLAHPSVSDLRLELISPDGTNCTLVDRAAFGQNFGVACSPDVLRTTFDDAAVMPIQGGSAPYLGSFRPQFPLAIFNGKSGTNVNGPWTLRITDSVAGRSGTNLCWSLFLTPGVCQPGSGECPGVDVALQPTAYPSPVLVGNNLTYTIAVTNNGPSSATNVMVTCVLPGGVLYNGCQTPQGACAESGGLVSFSLGNIPARTGIAPTIVVLPLVPGSISLLAAVSSAGQDYNPGNNSATLTTTVNPATSDLAVTLAAAPSPGLLGAPLTYTVTVTNRGPSVASGITVTTALPDQASIISRSATEPPASSFATVGQSVLWTLPGLSVGSGARATIVISPGVEGTATATAVVVGEQFDPNPANSTATVSTVIGAAADLAVSLVPKPNPAVAGQTVSYEVSVVNLGPSEATGVIVNTLLPSAFSGLAATPPDGTSTTISNSAVLWNVGTLATNALSTLWITATTSPTNGAFNSSATVVAAQADPNPANNSAAVVVGVTNPIISIVPAVAILTHESGPTNGAVDWGETVTMSFTLRNAGNIPLANLQARLLATNGVVPAADLWLPCGNVAPAELSKAVSFTFTATNSGSAITATLQLQGVPTNPPPVEFPFALPTVLGFANSNAISVPDPLYAPLNPGPGKPYPSVIIVSNLDGVVGKATVTLSDLTHSYPADVSALLVAPGGAKTLLMSHAGGERVDLGVNLVFDDAATDSLPEFGQLASGSYKPTLYDPQPVFSNNAPAGPYAARLSEFNGSTPNGPWSLYLLDDSGGDAGAIAQGWSLALTMVTPVNKVADLAVAAAAAPATVPVGQSLTNTFTLSNQGSNTVKSFSFTAALPAGVALDDVVPAATATNGSILVFTNLSALAAGQSTHVTLRLTPTTTAISEGLTNRTLSSTGSVAIIYQPNENLIDVNPQNDSATATATAILAADLGVTQTVAPDPVVAGFSLTNTLVITNQGPCTTLNVVLTNTFLSTNVGFRSVSLSQGTWAADAGNVVATLGTLTNGASATVTIVLTNSAPGLLTNRAVLSAASFDPVATNNLAVGVVTVETPAARIVNAGGALSSESGPANGLIDAGETVTVSLALANTGSLDTVNLVATLLPAGGVTTNPPAAGYTALLTNSYGPVLYGGAPVARSFTFKADALLGSTTVATLQLRDERPTVTNDLGQVAFVFLSPAKNPLLVSVPDRGIATPYSSDITVSNVFGRVTKATVTLHDLTHTYPRDINALLVSPAGATVLLLSHAGAGYALTNPITLTFDSAAPNPWPANQELQTGTNRPAAYANPVTFPAPAPGQPYGSTLAGLNGLNPNGVWRLYVYDDAQGDNGRLAAGWSLSLTTADELEGSVAASGQFHLTVTAQPGYACLIQASTNLSSWVPLSTNLVPPDGTINYTDTSAAGLGQRFYRTKRLTP